MKIVHINAVFGYSSTGTIVKYIHDLCLQNGFESYVAFPKGKGKQDDRTYTIGNFYDHKLHALLSRITGKQAYFSIFATKNLITSIKKINPDIVHLHNLHSNFINLNLLLDFLAKKNIATVITMHDCWYYTGGCFHYTNVNCNKWKTGCGNCPQKRLDSNSYFFDMSSTILKDRKVYLNAIPRLVMIGCSEWIANECQQSFLSNKDIRYIHNGFDFNIFQPSKSDWRKNLEIEDKYVIIGPASKWLSEVNKDTLDYFVQNMTNDMVLVLFGAKMNAPDHYHNIKTIGHINSPQEMAEIYSMADIMVNCSREDTLSSINIECQACGTPVVTYEATGNKETVPEENVISTGNYKSLFAKVCEIKNEANLINLSNECIQFVQKKFDKEINYSKYISLYQDLVNG